MTSEVLAVSFINVHNDRGVQVIQSFILVLATTLLESMDSAAFRIAAHKVIEDIIAYNEALAATKPVSQESPHVISQVQPGYLEGAIGREIPERGEPFEALQQDMLQHIMPGITHWQSPNFMAYFPANSTYPAMLGDMYSNMLTCAAFNWQASPAVTELETIVLDMLADGLGLGGDFKSQGTGGGVLFGTASEAVFTIMIAARDRYLSNHPDATALTVIFSDQTHSSTQKAANLLGLRSVKVKTQAEDDYRITSHNLAIALQEAGRHVFMIVSSYGATNACAVDDLDAVHKVAVERDAWVHVDAAYAGAALICPEYHADFTKADSIDINAHKWLLTNFDCSCAWLRERKYLLQAMDITPSYLRNQHSDQGRVTDYRNWGIPLGRRFRSLKLWFVLRTYGLEGMQKHIRQHIEYGEAFAELIKTDPDMELAASPRFALTVFRFKAGDVVTKNVYERINTEGRLFLTSTILSGQFVIRVVSASPHTRLEHLHGAYREIRRVFQSL